MTGAIEITGKLRATWGGNPAGKAWLARLPGLIDEYRRRWSLTLGAPFDKGICSWAAPATTASGADVVLKIGMPHMEAMDEIAAMRFWAGNPTAQLIDADEADNTLLLERCVPGSSLHVLPEPEQDIVIAGLLRRLWRRPAGPHPFRKLSVMAQHWVASSLKDADRWPDPVLTRQGLQLMEELARPTPHDVLLATDLHAGNVLAARREPWLVIDPKPFIGDPAYDATQHLLNCEDRMKADPRGTVRRFAELLGVDPQRARLWTFARLAAEPRDDWTRSNDVARALAP